MRAGFFTEGGFLNAGHGYVFSVSGEGTLLAAVLASATLPANIYNIGPGRGTGYEFSPDRPGRGIRGFGYGNAEPLAWLLIYGYL
jgi:hypothetical protein